MHDLAKFVEISQKIRQHGDSWKALLTYPGWFRDRILAIDYVDESEDDWEYLEGVINEAQSTGRPRDSYFISILEHCGASRPMEADFGAGMFARPCEPGSIILGDEANVRKLQGKGPFHSYMLIIKKHVVHDFFREATQGDQVVPERMMQMAFRDETLRTTAKQLLAHFRDPRSTNRKMIKEYLQNKILERLVHVSGMFLKPPSDTCRISETRLSDVLEYMRLHCTEDLSLNQLAVQAGVSRTHFVRLFRQSTGESPKQFQSKLRLEHARHLLTAAPHLSVLDIARQCGYYDQSHFAQAFRRSYRITPAMYRSIPSV